MWDIYDDDDSFEKMAKAKVRMRVEYINAPSRSTKDPTYAVFLKSRVFN